MSEGGSKLSVVMIDDFDFAKALPGAVKEIKAFAKEMDIAVWYTAAADAIRTYVRMQEFESF